LRQIKALEVIAPRRVWLLCDGPRVDKTGEAEKVAEVRMLLDNLPWDCEVTKLYREANVGCFKNVSQGITWFLNDCEAGIILEDDVIPDASFYRFADELLEKYAHTPEVFAIAGHNRRIDPLPIATDYGFSNYFECWGWATWKRAWDQFDPTLSGWRNNEAWRLICSRVFRGSYRARLYWNWMFQQVEKNRRDSWAYRFLLTIWMRAGCVIIPRENLTENIGFNAEATQTSHFAGLEVLAHSQSFPLAHPHQVKIDPVIDSWFEDGVHSKSITVRLRWLLRKLRRVFISHEM
jgi:hypothetical protein